MTNRLRMQLRTFSCCVVLLISILLPSRLHAQAGFFNFNYNGPDSLLVGVNCNSTLQGNIPNPIVTSTIGATIITSVFDATASGFPFNQAWIAGETAHVFWYVEDNMGHSYTFEFFVRFVDRTPPTFNLTGIGDTLYFQSVVQVPAAPMIPIMDNCTGFTQTFVETTRPDTCLAGQFTRTWTATDLMGNKSTFTQTIIIAADVTPPTITFPPQNGSSPCETLATTYPAWLAAQMAAFTAQDPSGIKSLTNNGPASFPPGCKVPLTVTFKATDNCNLMIPTTAVFTTSDNQGPVVTTAPKDTIAYCSPGGNQLTKLKEWIHTRAYMQVYDGCSAPLTFTMSINNNNVDSAAVVAAFLASFANPCGTQLVGSQWVDQVSALVRVDFLVRDACGNPTNAGQAVFAAVDTVPPVITGVDITEECGGGNDQSILQNWINAKGNATMTDDCSTAAWINFTYTTSNGQTGSGTFNSGPYPTVQANNCSWFADVTFHASDECGNASAKTLRFQIDDNQPPVITGLAPNITVYCPNPLPTVPAATITDNCDAAPAITFTRVFQEYLCTGSYTVVTTWVATDDCGNTTSMSQNIFVRDTTRPVFTLVPVGLLMRCDTFELPPVPVMGDNINATDLCSPVVSITTATESFQNPNPALCSHYSYHLIRTFTATDECGNKQTATQLISVIDNQPPIPGGVLDTTALCSALMPFPAPPPTAFDLCGGPTLPPVYVDTETLPDGCTGQYTLKLNWIATDFCGNQTSFEQLVHVIDTVAPILSNIPPDITVECNAIPTAPNPATFNGADNCSPGVIIALQEIEIRNPDLLSCDHWTNYTLRRQWTATDACGKARTYTQNIQIVDTSPPTLVPPAAFTLPTDMDDCGTSIPIPAPLSVTDICTSASNMVVLKDTLPILPLPNMNNGNTPVDTIVFHFSTPNLPPNQPATSNVSLSISIDRADADGTTEYFKVYGENGLFLDNTALTPGQCSNTPSTKIITVPADKFNDWASDGDLVITLAPNGTGGLAINPMCNNSQVRMTVSYTYSTPQVPIAVTYSLDGASPAPYPPAGTTFLGTGTHTVVYTAIDCAGNSSTASVQIVVNDTQPPSITAPAPITTYVGPGNCLDTIALPFPVISENCDMSGHLKKSSVFFPLSFTLDPDAGIVPADVTMGISGLIPNAIANGILRIKFKGDNGNPREFFNILHNVTQITTTNIGTLAGQCQDTVVTSISVSPVDINTWAATGTAIFRAEANTNAGPVFDFDFINPCAELLPNQTDGISRIQAMLEYSYAVVNFTVTQGATIVATGALQGNQTTIALPPGQYTVKYTTVDNVGLMGMTSFPLVVRDTIRPTAKCKQSLIVKVNPSGVNPYVLQPSELNNGSTDNCSGTNLTYSLSKDTFTCNQSGSNYTVTLTVTDAFGNTATCSTVVALQNAMPAPSYNSVCEGDTLQLFANPPTPGNFSYDWMGPAFSASIQDPVRLNAQPSFQGLYKVQITGVTGCTATGAVTVVFASLTVPDIVPGAVKYCQGQNITLGTQTYPGPPADVRYQWYLDGPTPTLLASTMLPIYTINQPPPGQYRFFVKVKIRDCLTPSSIVVTVDVFARPPAIVEDDKIVVCVGEPLAFGTQVSGPGLTYQWSGPGWAPSTAQFPLVTNSVTSAFAGFHILKTFQNGCESIPSDTVEVVVKYTPPKPQITGNTEVCVGDDVVLTANVGGPFAPTLYEWQDSGFNSVYDSTGNNKLTIQDVTSADCGNWRVRARYQGCFSEWSDLVGVCPQPFPEVTGDSNSPICNDSTLHLTATSSFTNLSWCWIMPDNSIKYEQNPTITPGLPGMYKAVGKTSYGCTDTAFVQVVVSVAPVIDSIYNTAPNCADGILGASLLPSFTSSNPPFTFSWANSSGSVISSQQNLHFPVVTPAQNGPYTLVIKDQYGCPSAPKTSTINVQAQVPTPVLTITPNPACAGADVTLSISNPGAFNGTSQFHWLAPNGNATITAGPQWVLNNVTVSQSGLYKVYVSQGACLSPFSNEVNLVVHPIPAAPVASSNQPICLGTDLQLNANSIPGATYVWTGPFGFSQSTQNPVRLGATAAFEGNYILNVIVNGCSSAKDTVAVDVMQPPKTPIIVPSNPDPVCLEQLPIQGFVSVSLSSQQFGSIYTWTDPATGDTIGNPSANPVLNFSSLPNTLLTPGFHSFQVAAWIQDNPNGQGCNSVPSNIVTVRFDTIPDNYAKCADDHPACATAPILLVATHPSGNITGLWSQIPAPTVSIINPDSSVAKFNGVANANYTFTWSLSSGGCKNFSVDTLAIMAKAPEIAYAGKNDSICDATNYALHALQGQYSDGLWSQLNQSGVTIADMSEPGSPVTGLFPGNRYYFKWTLEDIGCGAASDTMEVWYYSGKPNITGPTTVCTVENCAILKSLNIQNWETGLWTSKSGSLSFSPNYSAETTVCGLLPGDNEIYWTINGNACGANSRDTFVVRYEIFPVANPDVVQVEFGRSQGFQVLTNDVLPTVPPNAEIITNPAHGIILSHPSNGEFIYRPNSGFSGRDTLVYRICNTYCGENACDFTTVVFMVGEAGECFVPTVITPNNDDLNDVFKLPPECYFFGEGEEALIEVTIFNQWGDFVYHKSPFKKDVDGWDGTKDGQELPAGTYYYVVKFEGEEKPKAGFLLLQR